MRIRTQDQPWLGRLADVLEGHAVAMLTLDGPAGLTSRPMTPLEMDREGRLWMMASRELMAPLVGAGVPANLAFARPDRSNYVSVSGRVELVDDAQRKEDLWAFMARPFFDGPGDPDLTLLRFDITQADIWDGPSGRLTRLIAMAASAAAGSEIGLGEREPLAPARRER